MVPLILGNYQIARADLHESEYGTKLRVCCLPVRGADWGLD